MSVLQTPPAESDIQMARELTGRFDELLSDESVELRIGGKTLNLSSNAARPLVEVIENLAQGKAVAIVALDEELSPQEAAHLLNVSRPYAAKLFDEGSIPSRRVGSHRRALVRDVLAFKEREKQARLQVLAELASEGQRLNPDY